MSIPSIKRFLLIAIISLISVMWTISTVLNFHESQEQVEEVFDAELAQMSRMLQAVITTNIKLSTNQAPQPLSYLDKGILDDAFGHQEYNERGHKYEKKLAFQVWSTKGKLFFENHIQLPKPFGLLKPGFQTVITNQLNWRTFTLKDEDYGFWIKVAQREDVRTELTNEIAWNTTWPSLVIVPFLILILGAVIQKGLAPLRQISVELKNRDYHNLSALNESDYPQELKHMVSELNSLFERVDDFYERERRFTADAAHELRTPLSISKVHLQNIQQVSKNQQVIDFVSKALVGIDRLIHMVQQLLILSRLDIHQHATDRTTLILNTLCEEVIQEVAQNPTIPKHYVNFQESSPYEVQANETSLRILLRNLLDNAYRYADEGSEIEIVIEANRLMIKNQCKALNENELAQLFDRFKRGNTHQQGSGLGLSICQQICQQHGFKLRLSNRLDSIEGVCTEVRFINTTSN